jgi:hypothetical protein
LAVNGSIGYAPQLQTMLALRPDKPGTKVDINAADQMVGVADTATAAAAAMERWSQKMV